MTERVEIEVTAIDKASDVLKGIGGTLGSLAKIAGAGILAGVGAATAGLVGLGAVAKDFIMAASESEQVATRLDAQLAALGENANVSAKDINDLADQLSKISGFDDEALVQGQATLLRFGNLSKEQFKQAATAATDLAAITGMDLNTAFQQLGVALDNPEAGFGRLKRQIGDLTDAEKEQIKVAMEAGDVAKAQGVILDALARKTKGAAEAMGNTLQGTMNKLRVAFDNVKEDVGGIMLPYFKTAFKAFADTLITAFTKVTDFFKTVRFQDMLRRITDWFVRMMATIKNLFQGETITKIFTKIADVLEMKVIPSISEFAQRVGGTLKIALRAAWDFISKNVLPVLRRLWLWLQANLPAAIKTVVDWFTGTFLPALKTAGKWIEENVVPPLRKLWDWLKVKVPEAIQTFRLWWYNTLQPALKILWTWVQEHVVKAAQVIWDWLKVKVPEAIAWLKEKWNELQPKFQELKTWVEENVVKGLQTVWDWLYTNVPNAIKEASKWFNETLWPALNDIWTKITEDIIPGLTTAYDWLKVKLPEGTKIWKDELNLTGEALKTLSEVLNLFAFDTDAANKKTEETNSSFQDLVDTILKAADWIWRGLQLLAAQANLIITLFLDTLNIIKSLFSGSWAEILAALIKFGDDLRVNIYNILKALVSIFTNTKNWPDLKPMGRAMIDGLLKGWREKFASLKSSILNDITSLKNAILSALNISSPSRVFAEEIGKPMAQGVQVGFSKQISASKGAITNTLTPESYMTTGKRGGGGAPTIVINYSPTVSTASIAEFEAQFVPLVDQALRRVNRGKV